MPLVSGTMRDERLPRRPDGAQPATSHRFQVGCTNGVPFRHCPPAAPLTIMPAMSPAPAPIARADVRHDERRPRRGGAPVTAARPSDAPRPSPRREPSALDAQLARAVAHRARRATLQRFRVVSADDADYPRRREQRDGQGTRLAGNDESFFTHGFKGPDGRFFDADDEPNLAEAARPDLFVSDDGRMAIDGTAGGEAKTFFATIDVVDAGNAALRGQVRMQRTNRFLWSAAIRRRLYEVQPVVVGGDGDVQQAGLDVRTPQNCNDAAAMAGGAAGIAGNVEADPLFTMMAIAVDAVSTRRWARTLRDLRALANVKIAPLGPDATTQQRQARNQRRDAKRAAETALTQLERELRDKYIRLARKPALRKRMDRALRNAGMNARLDPGAGDVIAIFSTADEADEQAAMIAGVDPFPYHWATVVARSGRDYVTFENYARHDVVATDPNNDPLWFFRMYGTRHTAQQFHTLQPPTGIIGALPISLIWAPPDDGG